MNKGLRRILKVLGIIIGVLVVLVIGLFIFVQLRWDAPDNRPVPQMTAPTDKETVARGEYLYKYGNQCWGCHTTGASDATSVPSGGREFDLTGIGPGFGFIYAPNITPDKETGIGAWTDGEIVRSLREGLDRDGHVLFPMMPGDYYKGLADKDVLAMVAYLRSLPPVKNTVPASRLSLVAKALFALKMIKAQPAITQPIVAPTPGATTEYGKYLAINASGCSECHTPRDTNTGKVFFDRMFAGSNFAFGGEIEDLPAEAHAPNLTPDLEAGIDAWSEEQFIKAMRTGARPDGTVMLTMMPYPYYSFWTDDDLKAVYRYLRTVPEQKDQVPPIKLLAGATTGTAVEKGNALFKVYCAVCHGENGKGAVPTSVALARAAQTLDDASLQRFIRDGLPGTRMPGFAKTLSAEQVADVTAFIRSWK